MLSLLTKIFPSERAGGDNEPLTARRRLGDCEENRLRKVAYVDISMAVRKNLNNSAHL